MEPFIQSKDLRWQSDWNGYEVGYDDIPVVGFYSWKNIDLYINALSGEILEVFSNCDCEDVF